MDQKERLYEILQASGFRSILHFAHELGELQGNVTAIMNGTKKPSVEKAMRYGSKMKLTPEETLWAFYPEIMEKYYGNKSVQ